MANLPRVAVTYTPRRPPPPTFDFIPQNPLLNVGFVPPGNPIFPYDLSGQRPRPAWNPALYEAPPNETVNLPVTGTVIHPSTHGWSPQPKIASRAACYFDPPNVALLSQTVVGASLVIPADLNARIPRRAALQVDYPPNLVLNLLNSNPYVPVDLSGRVDPPRRNSSLYFETPNLTVRLSSGAAPVRPIDWNMRAPVRQPIVFDAPNLAVSLSAGKTPVFPVDGNPPVRPAVRNAALYDVRNQLIPILVSIPAVIPPGSTNDLSTPVISLRYSLRRLAGGIEQIPVQPVTILSKPVQVATIPNLNYRINTGIQTYAAGTAFTSASSYSISPALDAGITFNTATGTITTNTSVATAGTHGPYTITATNSNGSTISNAFNIVIGIGDYCVDGPRLTESTTSLGATYTVSGPFVTRDGPMSEDLS